MAKKKAIALPTDYKRGLVEHDSKELSINRQCELLSLSKGALYYEPLGHDRFTLDVMALIDRQHVKTPFYGSRKMVVELAKSGYHVNRKKVRRLMRLMGIQAIYPKRSLSQRRLDHKVYPYLLKDAAIERPNAVWSIDITYVPVRTGYLYLTAVIDWYSRYVLSWQLSNTLDVTFCIDALEDSLIKGKPEIFNSDQGSQFTSNEFTKILLANGIRISMDGRGRVFDNIFIERLWRSVKYENIYLNDYETGRDLKEGLDAYFDFYNNLRSHQALDYNVPYDVHYN